MDQSRKSKGKVRPFKKVKFKDLTAFQIARGQKWCFRERVVMENLQEGSSNGCLGKSGSKALLRNGNGGSKIAKLYRQEFSRAQVYLRLYVWEMLGIEEELKFALSRIVRFLKKNVILNHLLYIRWLWLTHIYFQVWNPTE